ncbi:MAG TPA: hypothetical protein VF787_01010 [Thermoanaerobaculia bacterium]
MEREFKSTVALALPFLAAVLLLDTRGLIPQLLLGIATAAFVWLICRRFDIPTAQILVCIAVATTGEIILSLGWGLYSYRNAVIPMYVPPGHAVFYALAYATARQPLFVRHERIITRLTLLAGSVVAIVNVIFLNDPWGFAWWIIAAALIVASGNQLMLSACVIYTMLLEWAGTANGNWMWAATVPGLGLGSANPPAGVGLLYVLLDIIVVAIVGWRLSVAGNANRQPV